MVRQLQTSWDLNSPAFFFYCSSHLKIFTAAFTFPSFTHDLIFSFLNGKRLCFYKHKRFSGVTGAQAPQPCASPSIPEHDSCTREGPAPVRTQGSEQSSGSVGEGPAGPEPAPVPWDSPGRGSGARSAAGRGGGGDLRGPGGRGGREQRCGAEEGRRRRGVTAARAAIKGPGAAERRILSPAATAAGAAPASRRDSIRWAWGRRWRRGSPWGSCSLPSSFPRR